MGKISNGIGKGESENRTNRILCLEDSPSDRELLAALLEEEGIPCGFVFAATQKEFESALEQQPYDLIISDFTLPAYDGMSALALAQKTNSDIPFIFVSGTIGEERAIESLKNGATDYVLKDRRDRLVSSVQRALREGRDRAERKKLEEQLRQAQKMEAIGQLAGGVAHDFNNLLAVIQGNAELALLHLDNQDPKTAEFLNQITEASVRAANLTRQLLAFGRKHTMRLENLNLNDLIANLTKMLNRIIGEDIRLKCDYDGRPFVRADAGMLEQVILNLVVNSRDAMPQGGQLRLSTEIVTMEETNFQPYPETRDGHFICLKVSDTGTGIAPENIPHIFEPFFTTKAIGKGTGLGLATAYGIVNQHKGWMNVSSQLGVGTTFEIFLPVIPSPTNGTISAAPKATPRRGSETIFLVEDDDAVRQMTRQTLETFGYHVIEAGSGRQALEVWQHNHAAVDLLLTDIVMPDGINGRRLAELLQMQTPELKAIFVSGYSLNVISKDTDFFTKNENSFLQKPYSPQTLVGAVRRCLDQVPEAVA